MIDFESLKEASAKTVGIVCVTGEEYAACSEELERAGYRWQTGHDVTAINYWRDNCYLSFSLGRQYVTYNRIDRDDLREAGQSLEESLRSRTEYCFYMFADVYTDGESFEPASNGELAELLGFGKEAP